VELRADGVLAFAHSLDAVRALLSRRVVRLEVSEVQLWLVLLVLIGHLSGLGDHVVRLVLAIAAGDDVAHGFALAR